MSNNVRRLFASFQPSNYKLELRASREQARLHGTVVIAGKKVGRPSQRLTFHQKGLKITSASITKHDKKGDREIPISRINLQQTLSEVRLHAGELLHAGFYTVSMEFEAPIQDSMHGVYFCNYEVGGQKQQLVGTQFESHHAREAFPCIDEPESKATFDLRMHTPAGEACLSNSPAKSQHEENGQLISEFETSPKMSAYLLAFVFGDLQMKEAATKTGVVVRVWATKAHRPQALDFGLDVATRGIEFFDDYYGVPYPLPKCDHVALPDFSVGAMENWGLITYRETCLLADPATATQGDRERVAITCTHELSHQWFGDLVTMKWWDDLWLNESFANVMEYVAVDALFPQWHIWNSFAGSEGLASLRRDCIAGVQPVKVAVHHPDEISALFDPSIVYAKGGRLLNMLKNYLGEDAFRRGLKLYFETHAYGNTTGNDLWAALSTASGKNVTDLMEPWLARPGFPVISVSQQGKTLDISQAHFLLDPAKADPDRLWPVPLLADSAAVPTLLESKTHRTTLPADDFVQLDKNAVGHYIVHYQQAAHAQTMAVRAEKQELNPAERLMLLSDSSMLSRGGVDSFASTLRLLEHYAAEDSEPVWDIMSLIIGDSRRFVDMDVKLEDSIKARVRTLIEKQYQRLGWAEFPDESSDDTKLRATVIALGVFSEHPEITQKVLALYRQYLKNPGVVSSELRGILFCAAIRHDVPGAFDYLANLHETTADILLREEATSALTGTRSPDQARKLLGRLTNAGKVKPQDVDYWLVFMLRNRFVRGVTWDWFKDNWDWLEKTFLHDMTFDHLPRYVASAFNTPHLLDEYKRFFEPKSALPALTRSIAMGIEEVENRVAWLERDLTNVQAYFAG